MNSYFGDKGTPTSLDARDTAALAPSAQQPLGAGASASVLPSASASVPLSPSASVSAPASSATPKATTKKSTTSAGSGGRCGLPKYPTKACTGVPSGWKPKTTVGDLTITKSGTVISDYLVTGSIAVKAANVQIRRTRVYGTIDNYISDKVYGGLLIADTEVVNPPGQEFSDNSQYAFGVANYTCLRCKVVNRMEGWRVGAEGVTGSGTVTIKDSFAQLAIPPGLCQTGDPHGDGIQSYGGPTVNIVHNTIDQRLDDCPTAPIFIPDQGNAGGTVEDNLLAGGGYSMRLTGGSFPVVTGNKVVENTPGYGPAEVDCSKVGDWGDNAMVTFNFDTGAIIKEKKKIGDCG
ncbi:hypothetical protein [Actinoplanes awajinensis]|uniref:Right handed beta helix domain-containing protein n=1 Tax=Actinoplanes awajinensis subsp. mycoplanecinus TaxID=135947 RepID=A0A0X3V9P7_9ACTN|nr:hypothetical protein [Actinoplanes awajinensis]KUL40016.1 hypothetical protein ADL15_08180 [Actinoplanes awajinensis subsp. mycoplanecinus]